MSKIKQLLDIVLSNHNKVRVIAETLVERIEPSVPSTEMEKKALALYKGPFHREHGYIFDAKGQMVADDSGDQNSMVQVRGWGRITYMDHPEQLQDAVGDIIAKALTLYWDLHTEKEGDEKTND